MKAEKTAALVRHRHPGLHWWCPQLPPSPREAMARVSAELAAWQQAPGFTGLGVIGSSLGGFYATWVAEHTSCRAVLLNPAVDPARDLARYVGEQQTWQSPQDRFFFKAEFVDELRALRVGPLTDISRYFAVIAKGDEVLDWREMHQRYAGACIKLLEGGDHALSDYDSHLDEVMAFLEL
jgi:uncharacterized protein